MTGARRSSTGAALVHGELRLKRSPSATTSPSNGVGSGLPPVLVAGLSPRRISHVDRRTCSAPPLYVHRGRAIDFHHRSPERDAHPHRYFSQHRHTGAEHRVVVQRLLLGGHGAP